MKVAFAAFINGVLQYATIHHDPDLTEEHMELIFEESGETVPYIIREIEITWKYENETKTK